jgi:hypothetical protein
MNLPLFVRVESPGELPSLVNVCSIVGMREATCPTTGTIITLIFVAGRESGMYAPFRLATILERIDRARENPDPMLGGMSAQECKQAEKAFSARGLKMDVSVDDNLRKAARR